MSENAMGFEAFKAAAEQAQFAYVRPYGLYHKGQVYWASKLPRKRGTVVRFAEDLTGPCPSLMVFDLDGNFLCNAWPPAWHERDLPMFKDQSEGEAG
jgi:hypothetical protein